jgi:DNA-binding NtrC family response regulator
VTSQPGIGSEFRVALPLVDSATADTAKRGELAAEEAHGRETILLVDDDDSVRQTLAGILKHTGFDVLLAKDGVDALEILASGVKPAAILSDIVMPRMNGLELVRTLADRGEHFPVVLATGHADLGTDRSAPWLQGITILNKPMTPAALITALRNAIDSSALSAAPVSRARRA